jgi:hypothetical protein
MVEDLTHCIFKCCSSWDLYTGVWVTSRAAEVAVQLCRRLGARFSQYLCLLFLSILQTHWLEYDSTRSSDAEGSIGTCDSIYHIRLSYSHKVHYLIMYHALFWSLYIYPGSQSKPRWYSTIVGWEAAHAHYANLDIHHLEAAVAKQWS